MNNSARDREEYALALGRQRHAKRLRHLIQRNAEADNGECSKRCVCLDNIEPFVGIICTQRRDVGADVDASLQRRAGAQGVVQIKCNSIA